jgi:hypothetical protein
VDVGGSDALDAPIGGNDAAIDSGSVDTGTVSLDVGAVDVSVDAPAIDTSLVALDTGIDTTAVDLSGIDLSGASCIQRIIDNGFASGSVGPCSSCHDNGTQLQSECEAMINCLLAASCTQNSASCHLTCKNSLSGGGVLDTCVSNLVADSCPQ